MEPRLILVRAVDPGQGKTMVCQDLVAWLRSGGHAVGGFSVRRAYGYASSQVPMAYYAHLYATDELVRISHPDLRADELMDIEKYRRSRIRPPPQNVSDNAIHRVLEQLEADHANTAIDVLVVDELGPVLTATRKRKNRRAERLPGLVERIVTTPKAITIIVSPNKHGFEDANHAESRLQVAARSFPGTSRSFDLNPHTLPALSAAIISYLATA